MNLSVNTGSLPRQVLKKRDLKVVSAQGSENSSKEDGDRKCGFDLSSSAYLYTLHSYVW